MSDPEQPKPKRGRGRARPARDRPPQLPTPQLPVERPGELGDARRGDQMSAQQPKPTLGAATRSLHRGASRHDPPRPGDVEQVTRRMGELSASQGGVPYTNSKTGSSGQTINIVANYFNLTRATNWCVYQYHVDFSPTVESSRMRRGLLSLHRELLGSCYLFDGMSDLKNVTKLENPVTEVFSQRKTDGENIRITLKLVAELNPQHPELGRLFNTQMRRNLQHLKYVLIGRHFFDQNQVTEVSKFNLQIWKGVVTSIRMQERDLMMLVDTAHRVIRKTTGLDVLNETRRNYASNFIEEAAKVLVGAIVMTRYNNRTYRIEDICWDEKPVNKFSSKDGEISFMEYYQKQYDIRITDKQQPLFLCTSKEKEIKAGESKSKRIMLIPELCCVTGLDEKMRSNMGMMRELATMTKLDPVERARDLTKFMGRLNSNQDVVREMTGWNLGFEKNLVSFQGRVMPPESIFMGRNCSATYNQKSGDFSKEMRGKCMVDPIGLTRWIMFFTRKDRNIARDFKNTLARVCSPMGMQVADPEECELNDDRISTFTSAFKDSYHPNLQMVIFILPNNKKDRYDALKKLTCLDYPVPSQVATVRTLTRPNMLMSIATKIGIQVNCKLGGVPWHVQIPLSGAMVIGYDTYHDSSRKGHSAGGFVASMDKNFTKWYSKVNFHRAGGWEELSNHLQTNLAYALRRYREINGCAPKAILFYRDGVGDGQIRYVKDWEVGQFKDTINRILGSDSNTKYAFTVVNKRINTRLFAQAGQTLLNPPPGTVVDDVVTRYDRYDYYLISQTARQGTVSPTMYNIIADTSALKPDHMQRLSYKLTHLYYNWAGTISVPAPCQYAHKLAFLAGQSLHRIPSEKLDNMLYYL